MKSRDFPPALWALNQDANFGNEGVQGLAGFDGSKVNLNIPIGCLLDRTPVNGVTTYNANPIEAPAAFGYCQTGERITLVDVTTFGPGFSVPGTQHEDLTASSALVCKTAFTPSNPAVQSLTLNISGLWRWTGKTLGDIEETGTGNRWLKTSAIWCREDLSDLLPLSNEDVRVILRPTLTQKGGQLPLQEFSMRSDMRLVIELADPSTPLRDALDQWVFPIWRMLTFCMGFRCSIDELQIKTKDGNRVYCYLPLIAGEEEPSKTQLNRMPLPYTFISRSHPDFLQKWLDLDGDAKRAASTLIGVQGDMKVGLLNPMFTTVSGAFEAISRVGEKRSDIDRDRFKTIKKEIAESLSDANDAQWVISKLNNIPPAGYYADALISKLGIFANYVVPDTTKFLKDLRTNRNAYVHQTSALEKQNTLSDLGLYSLAMAVKVLCYGAVMLQLGISPESILEQFTATGFCQEEINLARKMYSLRQE